MIAGMIDPAAKPDEIKHKLEKILALHHADCLSCPRAGACEIQTLCAQYRPVVKEEKRTLCEADLGVLIEQRPEKCIRCGRCVDFVRQVGEELPTGIMPVSKPVVSMLSGTLIDLCPAAALVDKTQKKLVRTWEMTGIDSIDVTDPAGTPVRIDTANGEIVRIVPSEERLISDKARFSFDGLAVNRLDRPYVRVNGALKECSWTEAFMTIASKLKTVPPAKTAALIGRYADCESMQALKDLMAAIGSKAVDARKNTEYFDRSSRQARLFNTPFEDIAKADALIIIGADLQAVMPSVAFLVRQNPMPKKIVSDLKELASETFFDRAAFPMVLVGEGVTGRPDAPAAMDLIYRFCKQKGVIRPDWNGYNFVTDNMAALGAAELGLISAEPLRPQIRENKYGFVYLLGDDTASRADLGDSFVVYQGIFGSKAAEGADVVLPGVAPTEKRGTYVNAEGVAQSTAPALSPFGTAREDWKILRALSEYLATIPLPYDDLAGVRDHLAGANIIFYKREEYCRADDAAFGTPGEVSSVRVKMPPLETDEICRNSARMRLLRKERKA